MDITEDQKKQHRSEIFKELGRLGGLATATRPKAYLSERGRKAVNKRWENYRARKAEEALNGTMISFAGDKVNEYKPGVDVTKENPI